MILMGAMEKLEELAGKQFGMFQPLDFTAQVVAGRNIQARIKIDEDEVMHVSMFVPLPGRAVNIALSVRGVESCAAAAARLLLLTTFHFRPFLYCNITPNVMSHFDVNI